MKIKKCHCGKAFKSIQGRKFCSDGCRREYERRYRREQYHIKITDPDWRARRLQLKREVYRKKMATDPAYRLNLIEKARSLRAIPANRDKARKKKRQYDRKIRDMIAAIKHLGFAP